MDPGLRFPLYNNATGKLLLAHLPDPERRTMIDRLDLAPCTPRTITDRRELERECSRIRGQGWSSDHAEADEGIHCIAAPISGPGGDVVAVLWISGPSKRLPKAGFADVARHVVAAGKAVTEKIGRP